MLPTPPKRPPRNRMPSNEEAISNSNSSPQPTVLPLRVNKKSSKEPVGSNQLEENGIDGKVGSGTSTPEQQSNRRDREKGSNPHLQNLSSALISISQEASPLDPFFGPNSTASERSELQQVEGQRQTNSGNEDTSPPKTGESRSNCSHSSGTSNSLSKKREESESSVSSLEGVERAERAEMGGSKEGRMSRSHQSRQSIMLSPPSPETAKKSSPMLQDLRNEEGDHEETQGSTIDNQLNPISPPPGSLSPSRDFELNPKRLSPSSIQSNSSGGSTTIDVMSSNPGGVPLHRSGAPLLSPALGGRSPEGPSEAIPVDVEESDGEFSMGSRGDDDSEAGSRRQSEDGNSSINGSGEEDEDDAFDVAQVGLGLQSSNTFNASSVSNKQNSSADRFSSSDMMMMSPPASTTTAQYALRKDTRDRQPLALEQPPAIKESRTSQLQSQSDLKPQEADPTLPSDSIRRPKNVRSTSQVPKEVSVAQEPQSRPISQPQAQPQPARSSRSSSSATSNSNVNLAYDPRSPADVPVTPFSEGNQSPSFEPGADTPAVPRIPGGMILSPGSALLTGGTNASTSQIRGSGLFGAMQNSNPPQGQRGSNRSRRSELENEKVTEEQEDQRRATTPPALPASCDLLSPRPNGNGGSSAEGSSSGYQTVTPSGGLDVSSSSSPPSSRGKDSSGIPFRSKDYEASPSKVSEGFSSDTSENELSPNGSRNSFSSSGSQSHGLTLRARRLRSRVERLEAAGKEVPTELNDNLKEIDTTLKIQRKGRPSKAVASKGPSKEEKEEVKGSGEGGSVIETGSKIKNEAADSAAIRNGNSKSINGSNVNRREAEEERREEVNEGNLAGIGAPVGLRARRAEASERSGPSNSLGFHRSRPGSSSSSTRSGASASDIGGISRRNISRPSLEGIGLGPNSRATASAAGEISESVSPSAKIAAAWRRPSNESAKASGLTRAQAQVQSQAQAQSDVPRSRDTSFEEPRRAPIPPRANPSSSSRPGTGNSVKSFGNTPGWGAAAMLAQKRPSTAETMTSTVLPSTTTKSLASSSVDPRAPWPEKPPPQFAPPPPPAGVEPHRPSSSSSTSTSFFQSPPRGVAAKVASPTQLGRFSFEEKIDLFGNNPPSVPEKDTRPTSASIVEPTSGWPGGVPSLSIGGLGLGAGLGLSLAEEERSTERNTNNDVDLSRSLKDSSARKFGSLPGRNVSISSSTSPISRGSVGVGGGAGFAASTGRGRALAASMAKNKASQSVDDLVGDKNSSASAFAPGDSIYSSRPGSSSNRMSADQPNLNSYSSPSKMAVFSSPTLSSSTSGSAVPPPFLPGAFARDRVRDRSRDRVGSASSHSHSTGLRSDLPYSRPAGQESVEDLRDGSSAARNTRRRSAAGGGPIINSNLGASSHGQGGQSSLSASGHSTLSASGHGHGHSREGSFDSNAGEGVTAASPNRDRFLSLGSIRAGSSSNLHANSAAGAGAGSWGGYQHSNLSGHSAVSSLHMQAGIAAAEQYRNTSNLSARPEDLRRPSTSTTGSRPGASPRSPSTSSYVGSGIIVNSQYSHSRPTTPNSQNAAYGRTIPGLREEDIEYDEVRENPEPSSLYGIRRRLVSSFPNLGSKHAGSSRPLSSIRGSASRTSLDQPVESEDGWDQGRKGQVLMDEKSMRKAEEKLEQREKNLTIEALSKQEVATVTISVYTEQREGKWVIRGPATRNGEYFF